MSSPTVAKKANKQTIAQLMNKRAAVREAVRDLNTEEATGKPTWASDLAVSALNLEFERLASKLAQIKFAGLAPPPEAKPILARMREIRRTVKEAEEGLSSWQGRYVKVLKVPGASMTTANVQLALQQLPTTLLSPNPWMSLEHAYSTVAVPPDDWVLSTLQCNPANRTIVEHVLKYVFANPLLTNMYERISRSAVHQKAIPIWSTVERWWKPAFRQVERDSVLTPMDQLPNIDDVAVDMDANPGYPFNVMPAKDGASVPFSTVEQVLLRDDGKFFNAIKRQALANILTPSKAEKLDERFWMYAVQSGNVKHVLRTDLDKKPNRVIFSSPLLLRLLAGAVSQPFYQNWHHPGSWLGSSFAHGETRKVLSTLLRVDDNIDAILQEVTLVPSKRPGLAEGLHEIHVKSGFVAAPDKTEYDLGMRPQPMEEFAKYTEGVLPAVPANADPKLSKNVEGWKKITRHCHARDGPKKQIVTNHRVVIRMDYANPSGSAWTTQRNTWINLASEDAADRAAWANVNKNRDFERWCWTSGYGDDAGERLRGHPDPLLRQLWDAKVKVMPQIGWEYKPGTTELTKNVSDLEILGRRIYAYVQDGKVLGFVGLRDQEKLWLTMVYPKEAIKKSSGLNPAAIRAARLVMLCDEAAFYPQHWSLAMDMFNVNQQLFSVKPVWAEKYEDFTFPVDYSKMTRPRSMADSMALHVGCPVAFAATRDGDSDDSSDLDVDLDDFAFVAISSEKKTDKKKGKEPPQKKAEEVPEPEEDLDVDLGDFGAEPAAASRPVPVPDEPVFGSPEAVEVVDRELAEKLAAAEAAAVEEPKPKPPAKLRVITLKAAPVSPKKKAAPIKVAAVAKKEKGRVPL